VSQGEGYGTDRCEHSGQVHGIDRFHAQVLLRTPVLHKLQCHHAPSACFTARLSATVYVAGSQPSPKDSPQVRSQPWWLPAIRIPPVGGVNDGRSYDAR
jgi:hypothetical protein